MMTTGVFSLTCSECGRQHDFSDKEADFDTTFSNERQMGIEHGYNWQHSFKCDKCNNNIEINYEVWEYLEGSLNNDQIEIIGGTEVKRFSFHFHSNHDVDKL